MRPFVQINRRRNRDIKMFILNSSAGVMIIVSSSFLMLYELFVFYIPYALSTRSTHTHHTYHSLSFWKIYAFDRMNKKWFPFSLALKCYIFFSSIYFSVFAFGKKTKLKMIYISRDDFSFKDHVKGCSLWF